MIVGIPDDFPGDFCLRTDEELAMAEGNLIQLSWEMSLGGIVTENEAFQAETLLAAIRTEINRRKTVTKENRHDH